MASWGQPHGHKSAHLYPNKYKHAHRHSRKHSPPHKANTHSHLIIDISPSHSNYIETKIIIIPKSYKNRIHIQIAKENMLNLCKYHLVLIQQVFIVKLIKHVTITKMFTNSPFLNSRIHSNPSEMLPARNHYNN